MCFKTQSIFCDLTFCKLDITHSLFKKVSDREFLSADFSRRENEVVFDAFCTKKPQIKHTKPRGGRFLGLREIVTAANSATWIWPTGH